jgi:RNA polymerase sigma-70 factor (family 1)
MPAMYNHLSVNDSLGTSFEEVFKHYYPRLCDFATRFLGDTDKAEDLVQDAFIVFHERKDEVSNHPTAIKNYLYTSVRYACLNHLRHEKVIARHRIDNKVEDFYEGFTLDSIIHAEIIGKIHNTIKTLPAGCAEVFKLGYFGELSNQEISEQLNISISTVKSQKKRALELLKKKISPEILALVLPFLFK